MWEAIAANQRRSWWLISIMGLVLLVLGAVIGATVQSYAAPHLHGWQGLTGYAPGLAPERPVTAWDELASCRGGALVGMGVAALVWLGLWLTAMGGGDSILLNSAQARELQKEDAPQLWNVAEEMTIAAGLPKMPRVFLIDDASLNAFAVGYRPAGAAVAVTAGLLKRLSRDELQGVIAHEIGHISNLDVRFMTLASVMVGAIVMIAQAFLRGTYYSGRSRRSSRGGGQAAAILMIVALLLAVLAPVAAQLLYFACSRRREYLADACSARFTRYPEGLASALEKIAHQAGGQKDVNKALAPLYIVNPLEGSAVLNIMSTHPATAERIRILRGMAGAGYAAYEAAFRAARGQQESCIGAGTLQGSEAVAVRAPSPAAESRAAAVSRARAVGDLLDRVLPLVVIPCDCGLKMKLPPGFDQTEVVCPRCGRQHDVPRAAADDAPAPAVGPAPAGPPLRYHRRGRGWESFRCACGHTVQLSPSFAGAQITCPKCRRVICVDG
jgi:heat shock protein HtpX